MRGADNRGSVKLPFHRSGGTGWLLLTAVVLGWDAFAPETMSVAFGRAAATPAGRAVLVLGWATLTAHLFDVLPEGKDPICLAAVVLRRRREVPGGGAGKLLS